MKYIITENQKNKLNTKIYKYLEDEFSDIDFDDYRFEDHNGYGIPLDYEEYFKSVQNIYILSDEYEDTDAAILIQIPSEEYSDDKLPMVYIHSDQYDKLTTMFGELWKGPFIDWIEKNCPIMYEVGIMNQIENNRIKDVDKMHWLEI